VLQPNHYCFLSSQGASIKAVKDLIVSQEFSSKKSLISYEGLLYKRQAHPPVFALLRTHLIKR
ncbi:hypothetical protein, partial [Shewanella putrefaciens]|uniref:hypothetical protein n=1 Tax=Shewanella putrefaciens TaxID=24 RepID=UPI00356AFCAB